MPKRARADKSSPGAPRVNLSFGRRRRRRVRAAAQGRARRRAPRVRRGSPRPSSSSGWRHESARWPRSPPSPRESGRSNALRPDAAGTPAHASSVPARGSGICDGRARPLSASARSKTYSGERAQGKALVRAAGITRPDERNCADLIVGGPLRHDVAAADPVAAGGVEDLVARMAAGNQGAKLHHADRPAASERPKRRRIDAQESAREIEFEPARSPVGEVKRFRRSRCGRGGRWRTP